MTREDLIETMAAGMYAHTELSFVGCELLAKHTLAAIEAAGCAVVPVVATGEMLDAAEYPLSGVAGRGLALDIAGDTYTAMIAASPFAKETGQ